MKNIQHCQVFRFCSLIFLLVLATPALAKDLPGGDLVVRINGLSSDTGKVILALVNSVEEYKARKGGRDPYLSATLSIKEGRAFYRFKNIPYGEYAIKAFHDENANGELDTNFIGIPREAYGFSNNVRSLGMPDYEKVKFDFSTEQSEITIIVK